MTSARDDYSWVPRYPASMDPKAVPEHLRENPLIARMMMLSPEEDAEIEAAARRADDEDAETVALLLADAR